jgi:L-seryl-tRNA(Ser) seleniumtransferase
MEFLGDMTDERQAHPDHRRRLPSVDRLLSSPELAQAIQAHGRALVTVSVRQILEEERHGGPGSAREFGALAGAVLRRLDEAVRGTLHPVINATGVIIHTNLGRAPLSVAAIRAMADVATGYSNLEYDLDAGERGSRYVHAEGLLTRLTGAEAALVLNNNAGAIFLALTALAAGREVVISRGQLVEIGGGFRIPDVLRQSGARLVEVGTTNRTHIPDFQAAIGSDTALLLRVHSSNFRQIGFTAEVSLGELVALGHEVGLPVVDDLGSGTLLDTSAYGLAPEPMVQESVAAGADLVTFSGDKLLGGPQAGIVVGRADQVERLRRHPLARALRVDKSTLAALQSTLLHYLRGEAESAIPVWRMIAAPVAQLSRRAEDWQGELRQRGIICEVAPAHSTIGGGSLPGEVLPTVALAVAPARADAMAAALRKGTRPVVARIVADRLLLDPRTVMPEEDEALLTAVAEAWHRTSEESAKSKA